MGSHPVFSPDERTRCVARARDALAAAGVAVGPFDEDEAMARLTGHGDSENRRRCVALPVEGDPSWVIGALDAAVPSG